MTFPEIQDLSPAQGIQDLSGDSGPIPGTRNPGPFRNEGWMIFQRSKMPLQAVALNKNSKPAYTPRNKD